MNSFKKYFFFLLKKYLKNNTIVLFFQEAEVVTKKSYLRLFREFTQKNIYHYLFYSLKFELFELS